jgi:hypothetical protein
VQKILLFFIFKLWAFFCPKKVADLPIILSFEIKNKMFFYLIFWKVKWNLSVIKNWLIQFIFWSMIYQILIQYNTTTSRGVHRLGNTGWSGQIHLIKLKKVSWVGQIGGYGFQKWKTHTKIGFQVKPDPTQKTHWPTSIIIFEIFLWKY